MSKPPQPDSRPGRASRLALTLTLVAGVIPATWVWVQHYRTVELHGRAFEAALADDRGTVFALLDDGLNVNTRLSTVHRAELVQNGGQLGRLSPRMSLLMIAAERGNMELAAELIRRGGDVNQPNRNGFTPLMLATRSDSPELIDLLVENGVRLQMKTRNNRTALGWAVAYDSENAVQRLIDHGALEDADNDEKMDVLKVATGSRISVEILRRVLEGGGMIDDRSGYSATLINVCRFRRSPENQLEKLRLLLEAGADPEVTDALGRSLLVHCMNEPEAVGLLLEVGADPTKTDHWGTSAMQRVAGSGPAASVELMLKAHTPTEDQLARYLGSATTRTGAEAKKVKDLLEKARTQTLPTAE